MVWSWWGGMAHW